MPEGGSIKLPVIPDFGGFGSLFSGGIRGALNQAEGLGKEVGKVLGGGLQEGLALGAVGVGVAVGDFVLESVKKYAELGKQTLELQHLTGATAQKASLFSGVLQHVGEQADSASRGLGIFADNIARQPALFAKYGVEIAKSREGTNNLLGTLDNLRGVLNGTADATTRDSIAKQLLDRSYQSLIGYLNLSNDQLALFQRLTRESGGVLDQKDVDRTRELAIDMQELKDKVQALQIALAKPVTGFLDNILSHGTTAAIPELVGALGELTHFDPVPLIALATGHSKAGDAARRHAIDELNAKNAIDQMGVQAAAAATALKSLSSAGEGVRSAQEGLARAEQGVAAAHRATQSAIEGVAKAEQGITTARENEQQATQNLTKAEAALQKLVAAGPVDAKAVEEARRGVDSANRAARDSAEALAAAEEHLRQVEQGASTDDLANARLALRSADLALAEARYQLSQPNTSTDPNANAQAALAVDEALQRRREAQENLTRVQEEGSSSDQQLADAQKAVRDASERVTDATTAQADAAQKLREAQAGDPDFDQKVADAKDAVAQASRGVRDAEIAEADAVRSLRDARQAVIDAKQGEVDAAQAVQDAQYRLRDANYELQDAWDKATAAGVNQKTILDQLAQKYPELAGIIKQFYTDVGAAAASFAGGGGGDFGGRGASGSWSGAGAASIVQRIFGDVENVVADLSGIVLPHRAGGGDTVPGQAYWVGEQGPEILKDGRVYPGGRAPTPVSSPQVVIVHAHLMLDGKEVATAVSEHQLTTEMAHT